MFKINILNEFLQCELLKSITSVFDKIGENLQGFKIFYMFKSKAEKLHSGRCLVLYEITSKYVDN